MMPCRRGFTLLEVMVAVAIVALSMGVIVEIESHAITKTNDAKAFTVATLLARGKMLDVQQKLLEDGYGDFMKVLEGDFSEEGFADFRWIARVRKVEVPTPPAGMGLGAAANSAGGSGSGQDQSMMLGMLAPMVQNVGQILENSVREIELRVLWKDGSYDRNIRIVTHVIDKQGLAKGIQNSGIPGMSGLPGMGGAGGLPGLPGARRPGGQLGRPQGSMGRPTGMNGLRPGSMRPGRRLNK